MHVQIWDGRFSANFLSSWRATFYYVLSKNRWGGSNEIEKSCIRYVRRGGCGRVCDWLARASQACEKEEGASRGAATAPAGRLRRRPCPGVRDQGRPEVHLSQRLLGRERRREGCQAGGMQSGKGCQGVRGKEGKEEKGVI